jgi:hypothetical protein
MPGAAREGWHIGAQGRVAADGADFESVVLMINKQGNPK